MEQLLHASFCLPYTLPEADIPISILATAVDDGIHPAVASLDFTKLDGS
jgi:hypothetical protein